MFELLDDLPSKRESFLKKYKYQYIADALTHLKELIDSDEFALMLENFKRRKNFVAILNNLVRDL